MATRNSRAGSASVEIVFFALLVVIVLFFMCRVVLQAMDGSRTLRQTQHLKMRPW